MNVIYILNVDISNVNMKEASDILTAFLDKDKFCYIVTPNPEMVMRAQKEEEFMKVLNEADLCVPDGIGLVIASKFGKESLKGRVAGCDLITNFFDITNKRNRKVKVAIFAGKEGVANQAKINLEKKFNNLDVVYCRSGYFKSEDEKHIIDEINKSKADIVLVGLGFPKQEYFIYKYKDELKAKFAIGCGGSIDVYAGTVKRAPKAFQKLGLEWFYRLLKQPTRFIRMLELPKFLLVVLANKIK